LLKPCGNQALGLFVVDANAWSASDHRREHGKPITAQFATNSFYRSITGNAQSLAVVRDERLQLWPFECSLVTDPQSREFAIKKIERDGAHIRERRRVNPWVEVRIE